VLPLHLVEVRLHLAVRPKAKANVRSKELRLIEVRLHLAVDRKAPGNV
jgi:hypothetical protein